MSGERERAAEGSGGSEAAGPHAEGSGANEAAGPPVLTLSARDPGTLAECAERLAGHLEARPELDLADICHTAAVRRSHLSVREAVWGSRERMLSELRALASAPSPPRAAVERVLFCFPEPGSAEGLPHDPLERFALALEGAREWLERGVRPDAVLGGEAELHGVAVACGHSQRDEAVAALEAGGGDAQARWPAGWAADHSEAQEQGVLALALEERSPEAIARQLAHCYRAGIELRWRRILPRGRRVDLPTYPFQRQRFPLFEWGAPERDGDGNGDGGEPVERAAVRALLGLSPEQLEDERPLSEYGLDSLLALELREALGRAGVWLDLETLTADPSVAELIAAPRQPAPVEHHSLSGPLPDCPPDTPFRLTDIQKAYWIGRTGFVVLGDVSCHFYTEIEVERLDVERLQDALNRLIARHDALRIVIDRDGRQRVLSSVPRFTLEVLPAGEGEGEDFQALLERERERVSHEIRPADRWPLFAWRLLDRGGRSGVLQISYDLLIADAASLMILTDELARLYLEPHTELDPLGVSFGQCVLAERPPRAESRSYWRARLEGFPEPPPLPIARPAEELRRQRFTRLGRVLEGEAYARLVDAARAHRMTPAGAICAAFAASLGEWSQSERFALNVTVYRRPPIHPDAHRVVGDFTSFDLLEVELSPTSSFAELAAALKARLWSDMAHIDAAGVHLLRDLSERRGEPFLAPVVFTSLLGFQAGSRLLSLDALGRRGYTSTQTPQVWLDHQALRVPGGVELTWDLVEEMFDLADANRAFARYAQLLRLLEQPAAWRRPVGELFDQITEELGYAPAPRVERASPSAAPPAAAPLAPTANGHRPPGRDGGRRSPTPDGEADRELIARIERLVAQATSFERIGLDEDLLAAGATSIELIGLAALLEQSFGVRPPVRDLYRVGTIRKLAAYYEQLLGDAQPQAASVLADPGERERIKRASRRVSDSSLPLVTLSREGSAELPAGRRRSCRSFAGRAATLSALGTLLAALCPRADGGRRYPSAGASYPVRVFLHVPGDGVEGLSPGVYVHDPAEHGLRLLSGDGALDRMAHWPSNRKIFDQAAFGLFLVGDMKVIEPLYGEMAREFSLIEAGAIAQLLMESAGAVGLGLCPIGGLDVAPVRELCGLADGEAVLLGMLGGLPAVSAPGSEPAIPRFADTRALAERARPLEHELSAVSPPPSADPAGGRVLVTGATGFLGAHLLRGLLDERRAVTCLTRAPDAEQALARIRESMSAHGLWRAEDEALIEPLAGDLTKPAQLEQALAAGGPVGEIFHTASLVNWILPLEALWEGNVLGTKLILELAARCGARLHHISSTAVFPFGAAREYGEDNTLEHGGVLVGGYAQSKWLAERLTCAAAARGVAVTVYRPGIIAGSSTTGSANPQGFFESMIRGCIELGVAPVLQMGVDVVPVDFVARALLALAARGTTETVHLVNPHPAPYEQLLEWVRARGYEARELPFDAWREEVLGSPRLSESALGPFADYLFYADAEQLTMPTMRCDRALAGLEGSGVSCPPVDGELLDTYIAHLVDREMLAEPSRAPA